MNKINKVLTAKSLIEKLQTHNPETELWAKADGILVPYWDEDNNLYLTDDNYLILETGN